MSDRSASRSSEADPSEVEPTDNSSGAGVDLERVDEVERELGEPDR